MSKKLTIEKLRTIISEELSAFHEMHHEEEPEPDNEPDYDNDCFIQSNGNEYSLSCSGKFIGKSVEMEPLLKAAEDWKKKSNWFPATWFVSDHGNYWPIDAQGNEIKENIGQPIKEEETAGEPKKLSEFAKKYNISPSGNTGKFALKDFASVTPKFEDQELFNFAMCLVNIYLNRKIGLSWDDLPDTNSLWDYIEKGMSPMDIMAAAKDAADERLGENGFGG